MAQPRVVRIPLDTPGPGAPEGDGGVPSVTVEVDPVGGGVVPVARPGEVVATAARTLGETFDQVRGAAEVALHRLASLSVQPQRIELELGVKLGAEAGALIARTAAEGNVVLRLVWQPSAPSGPPPAPAAPPAPSPTPPAPAPSSPPPPAPPTPPAAGPGPAPTAAP